MKYIHFVLLGIFALLFTAIPATALDPSEPILHYSESVIEIDTELTFDQGYTLRIVDINDNSGDVWVEVLRNGKLVDDGDGLGEEDDPFEYILTVEAEDDDEDDEKYLIFRVTPQDVVSKSDPVSAKIRIEQFRNPSKSVSDFLIYDDSMSVDIGDELDLEGGYSIRASDYDEDDATITLILEKNGHKVKEVNNIEKGDIFSHYKIIDDEVTTVVIARVHDFFESSDTHIVFLKDVSQKEDVVVKSNVVITVEGLSGEIIKEDEMAIIRYELDNDASEVKVYVDDDKIDVRNDVDEGTYASVTEKLEDGIHEVKITIVSTDGSITSKESAFTVEKASSITNTIKDTSSVVEDITKLDDVVQNGTNATGAVSDAVADAVSESVGDVKGSSGFSYIVVAILIALTAFFLKREFT